MGPADRPFSRGRGIRTGRPTVEGALAEFPGESDLVELGNVASKSLARAAEALELLARARELSENSELEASLELLRQAAELDPRNMVVRTVLVNSLLEASRRFLQIPDWQGAERLLRELLALDPNHAGTESLASEIAGQKREAFVSLCITQARRLQAEGDIGRALAVVAQGLQAYPNDPRFEQLRATLQRAQSEAPRPPVPRGTPDTAMENDSAAAPPNLNETTVMNPPPTAPASPPPADMDSATLMFDPGLLRPTPPASAAPEPLRPPPASSFGQRIPVWVNFRNLLCAMVALAAVATIIIIGVTIARSRRRPPPQPVATFKVMLRSSPEGAEIKVGGRLCGVSLCQVQLPEGNHTAEATLSGYQTATETFSIAGGKAPPRSA